MIRRYGLGISIIFAVFINVVVFCSIAFAVSGTCFFSRTTCSIGDASNPYGDYITNDVFSGRDATGNGYAIGTEVNTPSLFIDFIKAKLSGDARNRTGAEFTIAQLIGKITRPTSADITDFENRMNQSDITVKQIMAYPDVISFYDPANNDDFYAWYGQQQQTVLEIRYKNTIYAQLDTASGGMIAGAKTLPATTPVVPPVPPAPTANACRPILVTIPQHLDVWDSPVSMDVYAINNNDSNSRVDFASSTGGIVNMTVGCTTGDPWTVYVDINNHPETKTPDSGFADSYSDPLPSVLQQVGPCYDYLFTTSVLKEDEFYRVESNSEIEMLARLRSDSWTQYNDDAFYDTYITHTKNQPAEWQMTELIYYGGAAPTDLNNPSINNKNNLSADKPCDFYRPHECIIIKSNSGTVFNHLYGIVDDQDRVVKGPDPWAAGEWDKIRIGDYPAGTKVCFAFSVKAYSSDGGQWTHSALNPDPTEDSCVTVVKKPKVQVWGGDLSVGKSFTVEQNDFYSVVMTTRSKKRFGGGGASYTFGSWAEYGIFANGTITNMASGSAFSGAGLAGASVCGYSKLSFVNTPSGGTKCTGASGTIGNYSNTQTIPNVAKSFPVSSAKASFPSSDSIGDRQGVYTASGDISITGSTIKKGQWVVINAPTANVTITGNINYTHEILKGINEIPQLVIIANNIIISDNVTNVDAWLVASGDSGIVKTCSTGASGSYGEYKLTTNTCNLPLVVNGPVMARELWMYRTGGSGIGVEHSGDPAEIFNLRADAYLWSYARSARSGSLHTVYTTEMPPRL